MHALLRSAGNEAVATGPPQPILYLALECIEKADVFVVTEPHSNGPRLSLNQVSEELDETGALVRRLPFHIH